MQDCDVFVLPSLGETFGVVLGEAMACGKPVLSTRCGGPEDVVTSQTGILVPPGDPASLALAMKGFLTHSYSFHPRQIRNSVVQRFGATSFLNNMEQFYQDILHNCAVGHTPYARPLQTTFAVCPPAEQLSDCA